LSVSNRDDEYETDIHNAALTLAAGRFMVAQFSTSQKPFVAFGTVPQAVIQDWAATAYWQQFQGPQNPHPTTSCPSGWRSVAAIKRGTRTIRCVPLLDQFEAFGISKDGRHWQGVSPLGKLSAHPK
jgi:hypothetical protein